MNPEELQNLSKWIDEKSREVDYGEVSVLLKFHNHELRHIEKVVKQNALPMAAKPGRDNGTRNNR